MATETDIVNNALRRVGAGRIMTMTDDLAAAGIAEDVYAHERDDLLQSHVWNFAITRKGLSRLVASPGFEFQYAFSRPADCLRIVSVYSSESGGGHVRYKAESIEQGGGYIAVVMSDSDRLWMRYVRRVVDPNLMSPTFRQVLSLRLARIFATAIANSNSLYQLVSEELAETMRRARSVDGIEDWPERLPQGSWADSRVGSW